jgi:hypothetical protein
VTLISFLQWLLHSESTRRELLAGLERASK